MSTQALTTIDQFSQMPSDERVRFELVDGELMPVPSPTPLHSWIRDGLGYALRAYLNQQTIGLVLSETDCRINDQIVRRPDLSFLTLERWRLANPNQIPLPFPPDIAVEVLSPSEAAVDVSRKLHEYLAAGTQEVWLIDAFNREITIRTRNGVRVLAIGSEFALSSPLLPGFSISVAEVLAGPPA
jgi:Uma2 family endonuclease